MTLRLNGATSGYTELDAPAIAGSNTLVLPDGNGTNGQILGTDGSGNLSWVGGRLQLETAKASTSGTEVDFTGIPSWVKRITVMFDGVSTSGTSNWLIQLGDSGGVENTGYVSSSSFVGSSTGGASYTAGFGFFTGNASHTQQGSLALNNVTGNVWVANGTVAGGNTAAGFNYLTAGTKTLSGTLDRVRITTVNGTDTFDAGTINLLLEG